MSQPCDAICDPTVTRQFDQTSGRYNDRSAFANNASQDGFVSMQMMFLATAQNTLEQNNQSSLADAILMQRAAMSQPGA